MSPENNPSLVIYVKVWLNVPGYENLAVKTEYAWYAVISL